MSLNLNIHKICRHHIQINH